MFFSMFSIHGGLRISGEASESNLAISISSPAGGTDIFEYSHLPTACNVLRYWSSYYHHNHTLLPFHGCCWCKRKTIVVKEGADGVKESSPVNLLKILGRRSSPPWSHVTSWRLPTSWWLCLWFWKSVMKSKHAILLRGPRQVTGGGFLEER
jgi:hypothetical protein